MVVSSHKDVIDKKKISVCRVQPLNKITPEEHHNMTQEESNDKTQEERAKDFNRGLEEIFLFDLLTK